MKILLLMDNPMMPTGYASTCRLTAKELVARGHQVYAISFNGGPQADAVTDWYGIKIIPNYALKRNPHSGYGDAETIKQIHKDINPDIFFFHNDSYRYSYIRELPDDILSKSVFWLPFEGETADTGGVTIFGKCAATRFVTKYALGFHADLMKGLDIGAIPHAIDLGAMSPCADKEAIKSKKTFEVHDGKLVSFDPKAQRGDARKPFSLAGKFVVSRVDRHQPRKYWNKTIEAFAKFAKDKDDVVMLCKCDPRDMCMYDQKTKTGVDLEKLAIDLGIRDKVFFDDFFFAVEALPSAFYHPADVFVSTTSGEGFGLSPVEAMACGTPLIVSNVQVLPEVLGPAAKYAKLGGKEWYNPMQLLHNVVDVGDVAEKLEWAYQDWKNNQSAELKKMSAAGRKRAEDLYSPKVVYDAWDKTFRDVVEQRDMVSVVTVLYNMTGAEQLTGDDGIDKLADSMLAHVKHPYEWIIVDNGSPEREKTREWMRAAASLNPRIKLVFLEDNIGFAGANNAGIAKASCKWIVLANPDSEALDPEAHAMQEDWLGTMVSAARSDPSVGIVGHELMKRDDIVPGLAFPYFCNVLITRKCLTALKLGENMWLDESFWPAYYEDCDFVLRAMSKNFKVIGTNIPFYHKSGGTNRHAIEGGKDGPVVATMVKTIDALASKSPGMADFKRKKGELLAGGMQGLILGNIQQIQAKWGIEARGRIKLVWNTHIGDAVGFSQIAEGLIPELHKLGFDVYVNDWSNGAKVEDPVIKELIQKTRKALESGVDLSAAINIVCWLMESFHSIDAEFKVGTAFCESTKIRLHYQQFCNSMDRILTFSEFCRGVQKDSGFTVPIEVIPPGVHPIFMNYHERTRKSKFRFLAVGVSQDRKDTLRLVQAFCEAFPKNAEWPPECSKGFPFHCNDVELVVKSNNFGELDWIKRDGYSDKANVTAIFTGDDPRASRKNLSMQEMYDLYCSADCLVHPSHGEGIGMPILEGAATGMPVIFTDWSSPSEYLDKTNSYPCSLSSYPGTTFTTAYLGHGKDGENGLWANIHIGHMKFLMYNVIQRHDEAKSKGKKAAELLSSKFNWANSAKKMMPLVFQWEEERKGKSSKNEFDPMTFVKPAMEPVKKGDRVMIDICSKDRHSYLSGLLISLLGQTFKDWDVIIQCDDNDDSMPYDHQISHLVHRCQHEGHGWAIIRSYKQGPHIAHDRTLQMALGDKRHNYKLVCRIDDDIYVTPTFLQTLFDQFVADEKCEVGAVGGVYLNPGRSDAEQYAPKGFEQDIEYAGLIGHNVPWPYICRYPEGTPPRKMEHLYSSFMYRTEVAKAIGGYCRQFSQIGHREESDFSHRFFLGGYKLLVHPNAVGYHFAAPSGGIRSESIGAMPDKHKLAEGDHKIYSRRLKRWQQRAAEKAGLVHTESPKPAEPVEPTSGKMIVALTGGNSPKVVAAGVEYFSQFGDVYLTCSAPLIADMLKMKNVPMPKMIATDEQSNALLTTAMLAEGEHDFILCVRDTMRFKGDPTKLLSPDYDDYVFEVYQSYVPGRMLTDSLGNNTFTRDGTVGQMIGPEVANDCLLYRRRANATPVIERVMYSDMMVINDVELHPLDGKSRNGFEIMRVADLDKREWKKICYSQFPIGKLDVPFVHDVTPEKTKVSIIIPTAGRKEWLKKCIDSIYAHTSTPFEIIIVDNGSSDGTAAYLEYETNARKNTRVFRQETNLGYQKAVNIGVSKARGEYILLFNDDASITSDEPDGRDWLEVYIDALKANPKMGIVGPHEGVSPALGKKMLYFWCVMMKKTTMDEIGLLDDVTFRNYGGDDDYCERLRRKGYEIGTQYTHLRHEMTLVPDNIKKPELVESEIKLKAKWGYHDPNKATDSYLA